MVAKRVVACGVLAVLASLPRPASSQGGFQLTIDNIMRGPGLYGYPPRAVRWSQDSSRLYFEWKHASDPQRADFGTYVAGRDGSGLRKLTEEEKKQAPPATGDHSRDRKRTVFTRDGDVFLYDEVQGKAQRLTDTEDEESGARFTQDEHGVAYKRGDNLFLLWLDTGLTQQMTDIRPAGSPPDPRDPEAQKKGTESQEFLKKEEKTLIQTVREREEKRLADLARQRKEDPRKPFILEERQKVDSLQLSGDGKWVIASVIDSPAKVKKDIVPSFVTASTYTETKETREKVGDEQEKLRLAILSVETGEVKWADAGIQEGDKERELMLFPPVWSEDGTKAVVQGEAADNKDRWLFALDPADPKLRPLVHMHDDAWMGYYDEFLYGWVPDSQRVWFLWERDAWKHLYTVPYAGGIPKQLTSGAWEVRNVAIPPDKSKFLITTSEAGPGEDQVYALSFDGGARTRLTERSGMHEVAVSPDGALFADIYSYSNIPPELYIKEARADAPLRKVTDSPAPEFHDYPWIDPPIVQVPARDGVMVPARIYKPAGYAQGGKAVIFVHGAGYLQNVHKHWADYSREYLFHHFLMAHGYLVLDLDYRGSAGYGRDWRTAIYRHMGGQDLDDQVDAARWLVREHGVDPKRIGIYGGSYGGFITLMAMFTQPDVFAAGAALRPVSDWANYNHGYTSNILNTPQADADAYRRSSPIYFADGLKGALLICHGMVDTNVHFEDTVRLVQRLIELHKENWQLAVFPMEDHGFVEPSSWADEYKRIFRLFEQNLTQ